MARGLKWSRNAQQQRKDIFDYWNKHNKSKAFSKKLNSLIKDALQPLKEHPCTGRKTSIDNNYLIRVRHFFLIYAVVDDLILIIAIWDGRRDIPLP